MSVKEKLSNSRELFQLVGRYLMVEKMPVEEIKTSSGLIIAQDENHKMGAIAPNAPVFVRVVASGEGTYDNDTGEDLPLDTQPGAILLLGETSVRWLSHMPLRSYIPFSVGITSESEIQIKWKTEEDFIKWKESVSN